MGQSESGTSRMLTHHSSSRRYFASLNEQFFLRQLPYKIME